MLQDLITSLACEEIIPLAKYGSIICISVIENATNSKTRVIAARECKRCVEKCGLSGIGKKGIQATARILSEEHIAENKVAYLDLIETVVSKMNGDVQKYAKICGSSNLSIKAKEMVDSRMKKVGESALQAPKRQSRPKNVTRRSISTTSSLTMKSISNSVNKGEYQDDKPSLKLDIGSHEISNSNGYEPEFTAPSGDANGPFTFSFKKTAEDSSMSGSPNSYKGILSEEYVTKRDATSGAAASLRERLQQIRDKNKSEREEETLRFPSSRRVLSEHENLFYSIMDDVDNLLDQSTPLGQENKLSSIALVGLRKLHASLTAGSSQNTNIDPTVLQALRQIVKSKVSFCVEKLTR